MSELVHYAAADQGATLTLDSQPNRNALSRRLVAELLAGLDRAEADDAVKVVVVRASGPVFCSGADLTEAAEDGMVDAARQLVELQRRIVSSPKPVLARVHGAVRAGGIGIVAAADIALCSSSATFAFTEVRLALAPAVISLTVLPRLSSRAAALTFLTGETFDGAAAAEMGLVSAVVADDDLDDELALLVAELGQGHPQGLLESKRLTSGAVLARIEREGEAMAELSARLFGSAEARKAMLAFRSGGRQR